MKKHLLSALFALAVFTGLQAQDAIARQHNGQTYFYYGTAPYNETWLQYVFNQCNNGDTVYLPGVQFDCHANITLSTGITLIGTGIHPDSVNIYGANRTRITMNSTYFYVISGADNAEFDGITFEVGVFALGSNVGNQNVSNIKINRCEFDGEVWLAINTNNSSDGVLFKSCYLESPIAINNVQDVSLIGCTLGSGAYPNGGNQSTLFANCMFMNTSTQNNNTLYRDNIFLSNNGGAVTINEASRYYNNLFLMASGGSIQWGGNPTPVGNVTNNIITDVFTAPPTQNPYSVYSYEANYHLKTTGSNYSTYHTMSTTGGEVGLFGGNPNTYWKDGVVPFNPHWQELLVPANSVNGMLNLTFKGAAQTY